MAGFCGYLFCKSGPRSSSVISATLPCRTSRNRFEATVALWDPFRILNVKNEDESDVVGWVGEGRSPQDAWRNNE